MYASSGKIKLSLAGLPSFSPLELSRISPKIQRAFPALTRTEPKNSTITTNEAHSGSRGNLLSTETAFIHLGQTSHLPYFSGFSLGFSEE
jgi:hypothetical protein